MSLKFEQTCFACPEQYDVYDGGTYVGYVRLRHGYLRVSDETQETTLFERAFPLDDSDTLVPEEQTLYYEEANINPDGVFETMLQRETYLAIAERVINEHLGR